MSKTSPTGDRVISLGAGLPRIPERLLLAHARGEVLFIAGAGVSLPAGLPDFRDLVINVYGRLDAAVHKVVSKIPRGATVSRSKLRGLTNWQIAEIQRFQTGDYDVVLGMLERRLDGRSHGKSTVRLAIASELRLPALKPAAIHKALVRLADRGGAITILTTNFDLMLEAAARGKKVHSYSLGAIPRPSRGDDFGGILHIHGALEKRPSRSSDFVVSDQDFGEFYLRRRVVPDLIYDAARLFNIVLIGYSANDAPMRYLLNAVAADGSRFDDLKERYTFVAARSPDPVALEDWKGRGITPIPYDAPKDHTALLVALQRWAEISPINGKKAVVDSRIRSIVKVPRAKSEDSDRDLFDHLIRRSDANERLRLSALASSSGADLGWLDAISSILSERDLALS